MVYVFGEHELDVDRLELRHRGTAVALEPQTFDVLVHLVRHHERVVSKEELMDQVWGGRFVSETAVTSRIKQARRALGDDGQVQRFIRTHHGRGYRFVADVSERAGPSVAPISAADGEGASAHGGAHLDIPLLVTSTGLPYHLAGQGPPDLVLLASPSRDLVAEWEGAPRGTYLRGLATMTRLVRPGSLSSEGETSLEGLVSVLDDAACARAVLLGEGDAGPIAVAAAARFPERFLLLVLCGAEAADDEDLRQVTQPTWVIHRSQDPVVPVQVARRAVARIPEAELIELPGAAHEPEVDPAPVLDALVDVVETAAAHEAPGQRLTALVGVAGEDTDSLVSVLVGLGGRVRRGPERALVVSFDGPATAIRALGSRRARGFLVGVGVGLAIDEVAHDSELVSGHGVDVARLLAREARPGEVLVPTVIKDLLAGSGLHVEGVGSFDLAHVGPHPAYRWVWT